MSVFGLVPLLPFVEAIFVDVDYVQLDLPLPRVVVGYRDYRQLEGKAGEARRDRRLQQRPG